MLGDIGGKEITSDLLDRTCWALVYDYKPKHWYKCELGVVLQDWILDSLVYCMVLRQSASVATSATYLTTCISQYYPIWRRKLSPNLSIGRCSIFSIFALFLRGS